MTQDGETRQAGFGASPAAVIDVGSNSVRMEVAELQPDGIIRVLERVQKSIRLGHDTFRQGSLSPSSVNALVNAFRGFRRLLDFYGVGTIRAVATSAVREAGNSDSLLDRVMMTSGIELELIDPLEEGRLIVHALLESVTGADAERIRRAIVVEVGGGGTLLTCIDEGSVQWARTLDLGSVRLPQSLGIADLPARKAQIILGKQIRSALSSFEPPSIPQRPFSLIALGADVRLAARKQGSREGDSFHVLGLTDLRGMISECSGMTLPELMKRYGLSLSEGETLLPALTIVTAVASRFRQRAVFVSDVTMRDGLLKDLVRRETGRGRSLLTEGSVKAARLLAERYHVDPVHAEIVSGYALALFDELRREHGLGPRERLQLQAAALLHEAGRFVDVRSHHKHSFYLISNSEVFGLSREELLNVAHIARYHRRSAPRTSHLEFMALSRERRMAISKLAAILRVADCLDRQKQRQPRGLAFQRSQDSVYVIVEGAKDLSVESRALAAVGDLFEDIFGIRVVFARSGDDLPPPDEERGTAAVGHLTRQASLDLISGEHEAGRPEVPALLNRELSWLDFDGRVLSEAESREVPLLERLRFLAISARNLDDFFMIRVAGLARREEAGLAGTDASGMSAVEILSKTGAKVTALVARQDLAAAEILEGLQGHGIRVLRRDQWTPYQKRKLRELFREDVLPLLTPLALGSLEPGPVLQGLLLHVALLVEGDEAHAPMLVVVPVPSQIARFLQVPGEKSVFVPVEDLVLDNHRALSGGAEVSETALFRMTRDADVSVEDDDATDLLMEIEKAVLSRRRRAAVRLEISAGASAVMLSRVMESTGAGTPGIVSECGGLLDPGALAELSSIEGFEHLRYEPWPPLRPVGLPSGASPHEVMEHRDIVLVHPYEAFDPVIELMEWAAGDPAVLAIKQTLYRTSGDSPVIAALERAALNGKSVTVLVELKARFDEQRNAGWARRLEDAGCQVIYGVAGLKTHAKALLIVSREGGSIRRRVHLSTGNYNDRTAKVYSDVGLLTMDDGICSDISSFFNLLTGQSDLGSFESIAIAPAEMKSTILEMLEREAMLSSEDRPGCVTAKLNSLEDPEIIAALYRASRLGVKVLLNVRGICCLKPGVKGISENIEVVSVVDRFLEHARMIHFANGGEELLYLSSADWMTRNLDRRMELLFPVRDPSCRARLTRMLRAFFTDGAKGWRLKADGSWVRVRGARGTRAQEILHRTGVFREE